MAHSISSFLKTYSHFALFLPGIAEGEWDDEEGDEEDGNEKEEEEKGEIGGGEGEDVGGRFLKRRRLRIPLDPNDVQFFEKFCQWNYNWCYSLGILRASSMIRGQS